MGAIPLLPESSPFSSPQRAWLNGFFAGLLGVDAGGSTGPQPAAIAASPAPAEDEDFPWHDPAMPMDDRLKLAEGKPPERLMMAAMAQLDCGACGYLCQSYAEKIASGEETDLTKCSPGGKATAKKLKELAVGRKPTVPASASAPAPAKAEAHSGGFDRKNPFHAPLLECRPLSRPGSDKDIRLIRFALAGSGMSYEAGDALGVVPENDPELVEAVLRAMGARGDEIVDAPGGQRLHSFDALARCYNITKVSDDLAALLSKSAGDASEAETLRTLVEDDVEGVPSGWDVLDLLGQFPSARAPLG